MIIDFRVTNQTLRRVDGNYVVNLSKNYLKCRVSFVTSDWDGLDKYVVFTVKGENYRFNIDEGEIIEIPNEILQYKYFYVQAYGMNDEENKVLTTNTIVISFDNPTFEPLLIDDAKIEELVNMLGQIVNSKVNDFKISENKLICYYDETPLQVIPINDETLLNFLTDKYIEINTKKLDSKGILFYERYKLR